MRKVYILLKVLPAEPGKDEVQEPDPKEVAEAAREVINENLPDRLPEVAFEVYIAS